jgi:hypothetical protein
MSPQTEEDDMVEEIDEEDGTVSEDSRPFDGTLQFNGCQYVAVYIKSGNASGNKVENSGHIVPQVIRMFCSLFLAFLVLIRLSLSGSYNQIMMGRFLSPVTIGCPLI